MLKYNNIALVDDKQLGFYNIKNNDTITVFRYIIHLLKILIIFRMPLFNPQMFNPNMGNQSNPNPMNSNFMNPNLLNSNFMNQSLMNEAYQTKAHFENSPNDLQFILHQNPELAQAVLSDDINVLMNYLAKIVNIFFIFLFVFPWKILEKKKKGS